MKKRNSILILLAAIFSVQAQLYLPPGTVTDSTKMIVDKCGFDEAQSLRQLEILGDHWGYSYDSILVDLQNWAQSPYVVIDSLGASVQNRAIWQLTITSNIPPTAPRKTIFIHARTHPNEVQSFWVTREIIQILLSEEEFARLLREQCTFYLLPMYNPDGVELEYPRENANGIDLESNWNTFPAQPEVDVLRNRFTELMNSSAPIEVALNMHSSVACTRYFVYHDANGTSVNYTVLEQDFIGKVRTYFPGGIESWNYFVSWASGTPLVYPESWFWVNHAESVMALTYEDMNCAAAGDYDQTAFALLHGIADYLGLVTTAIPDENPESNLEFAGLENFPNPVGADQTSVLSTVVQYRLEKPQQVELAVYDVLGRQVKILDSGYRSADVHRIYFDASGLANGIYFFSLKLPSETKIKRFSVIR